MQSKHRPLTDQLSWAGHHLVSDDTAAIRKAFLTAKKELDAHSYAVFGAQNTLCARQTQSAMPICKSVLLQPCLLPRRLNSISTSYPFGSRRYRASAFEASSMVAPEAATREPTSEHAQRAWTMFREWGSPQYWVAPMVDQVRLQEKLASLLSLLSY